MAIQAQMYPENLGLPLGGCQDWLVDNNIIINNNFNGCGFNEFSFNLQHKQQQFQQEEEEQQQYLLQLQNLQQRNHCLSSVDNGFAFLPPLKHHKSSTTTTTTTTNSCTTTSSDYMSMKLSHRLAAQLEKEKQEIDRYINLQSERLKLALQQQKKQQLATILRKLETKTSDLLRQKDEEIAMATKKTMELEDFMRRMEMENQAWQRLAAENEAMVVSLSNTLEQLKEQQQQQQANCCLVNDEESCCDINELETGENRGDEGETEEFMMKRVCRVCNSRNSCVLFLPCRHLCCCKDCEAFLDACPVCHSVKKATIEALIS